MAVDPIRPEKPTRFEIAETSEHSIHAITLRSIIIGFLAIIPGVFWGVYGDVVSQTDLTSTSLMMPPVLILTALLPINAALRRIKSAWVLTQQELITIYSMMTVAVVLSGMGMIQFLCTTLGAVPHYKSPENQWGAYLNDVPRYILPKLSAIDGFYKGNEPVPWEAWGKPIVFWSGFLFAMLFTMTCINAILRKQWIDKERLEFPIVQLPLQMTDVKSGFFSNKVMWVGFGVAAAVETLNSLSFLYPQLPMLQIRAFDLSQFLQVEPWRSIGSTPTTFYPLAIGLGFVLAADVSFSCWFFFLFTRLENVFTRSTGWTGGDGSPSSPPYLAQQGAGAFIGIAISAIWLARRHLREVLTKAFTDDKSIDDSAEALSYRTATIGLVLGFVSMCGFCVAVGMSPLIAVVYLGIYILFATTITRLRAVAGPPWTMGPGLDAMRTMIQPVGGAHFSQGNLVAMAYFNWFSIEMRCCPMPTTLEGMKMAQVTRIHSRKMTFAMLAAIVAGIAVGFCACLTVWYTFGAETAKVEPWRTAMGRVSFDIATNAMTNPLPADVKGTIAMVFGGAVALLLGYIRTKFVWFPFHPVGYVLANTSTLEWLWCPFLVAWACKVLITKYGGIKGYRTALPFFLGLVLGDYITSSLWALAGSVLGIKMYRCFPC